MPQKNDNGENKQFSGFCENQAPVPYTSQSALLPVFLLYRLSRTLFQLVHVFVSPDVFGECKPTWTGLHIQNNDVTVNIALIERQYCAMYSQLQILIR